MSKNSLLLVDPKFKADTSERCHLLLKITNDSISYAVLSDDREEINVIFDKQGCADVLQEFKNTFQNDAHLRLNYSSIKIAIHTSSFIFIPDEWFDSNQLEVYGKYLSTGGKIHIKHHEALGFHTVFSIAEQLELQLPHEADCYPQSAPLLALSNHLADQALLIDFTSLSFNVLYVKDKKVQFQNHFPSETAEEFNYFLLLIMEQLELNEHIPVYLQGIINEDDDYYNCLLKYFNQLYFFLPTQKQNSELLADMPKHYFSGLLALDLCE